MGEVYRADDLELGQSVALKFLPERVATDTVSLDRFRSEVRTARQIAHPNVCRIYDIAEQDGHVFLSMEYIDGEDLAGVLRRLGRPSPEKATEIARQICLGLAAAHENRVLHRDLKPANIMIDGRGRVRITDFGLAGFLEELEGAEVRGGTPAYMAPEQLANSKVSVRSDIYTLGLILHELFTGKRVFGTDDIEELKRQHTSGTVSTPSSIKEEIDPAVERVIMRCLQQQPEQRPQSVYQILAALPGGDPLAAAVAAGETPSPELVANARDAGGLRPAVAVGLLVAMFAFLSVTYLVQGTRTVMPQRSPAVLSVVAEQIMEELGYSDLPSNSVSGSEVNPRWSGSLRSSADDDSKLAERERPPRFVYWRRWTDGRFLPVNFHSPENFTVNGPTEDSHETAAVAIDSAGRLLGLRVESRWDRVSSEPRDETDWSPLFRRAGLDESDLVKVPPPRRPPVYCDEVAAWRMRGSETNGEQTTLLTGAVAGRPNFFRILWPQPPQPPARRTPLRGVPRVVNQFVNLSLLVLIIAFAWRNLRANRGDRRNAFRYALITGLLYTAVEVLSMRLDESNVWNQINDLRIGSRAGGHIIFHAFEVWLVYMAIEPYVRRFWPRMMVALVRLFSGRFRDPAVGREVLTGVVSGCAVVAAMAMVTYAEWHATGGDSARLPSPMSMWALRSTGHFVINRLHLAAWAGLTGIYYAGFIIVVRLLTRRSSVAIVVAVLLIGLAETGQLWLFLGRSTQWALLHGMIFGIAMVLLYTQAGILAVTIAVLVTRMTLASVINFDGWFAPYALATVATLVALAAYGFWTSLAGQSILKDILAEPHPKV